MELDLTGAVDLHVHFGPDAHRERSVTAPQAARQAQAAGHSGILLKSHDAPTVHLAAALDELFEMRVFGGITCDTPVGGVNPSAVEEALRIGAKFVWLPTLTGAPDWDEHGRALGVPWPGVQVAEGERLLPEVHEVMRLVAEYGAVLGTGHVSLAAHLAVARAAPSGLRVHVTHALMELCGPRTAMTVDVLRDLVEMGVWVEFCAINCHGSYARTEPEHVAHAIREIGPERCTIGSDFGQASNPLPVDGLEMFARSLVDAGVAPGDVRRMAVTNTRELLGL